MTCCGRWGLGTGREDCSDDRKNDPERKRIEIHAVHHLELAKLTLAASRTAVDLAQKNVSAETTQI